MISRPSVMRFSGHRGSLRDIAKELNVDALVVGSVARADGKVRVTAQLYDAAKDRQLWSQSYERDMREVIALQRDIAQSVTSEIRAKLTPQETARLAKTRQVNPEAYDAYLRGMLLYGRHSNSDNQAAIVAMERAVALDPGFAAGHALLGLAYVERLFTFAPQEQKTLEEKAYVAVEKAISLDPDEAMGYFARGRMLWTPGNHFPHEKAIREYRHALALNPNLAEVRAQLALTYNHVGLLEKALAEARASASINPVDALPRVVIGQALLYGGQFDRRSACGPVIRRTRTRRLRLHTAWTLFQMGRKEEAGQGLGVFGEVSRRCRRFGCSSSPARPSGRKKEAEALIHSIAGPERLRALPSHGLLHCVRICASREHHGGTRVGERGCRQRFSVFSAVGARPEPGATSPRPALGAFAGRNSAGLGALRQAQLGNYVSQLVIRWASHKTLDTTSSRGTVASTAPCRGSNDWRLPSSSCFLNSRLSHPYAAPQCRRSYARLLPCSGILCVRHLRG